MNEEKDNIKFKTGLEGAEALSEAVKELEDDEIGEIKRFKRPPQPSKYFGQPVNWQKTAGMLTNLDKMQEEYDQQVFHKTAINQVKKALGSKCTFLAHVKEPNGDVSVQARLKINGTITTINVNLGVTNPDDFTAENYKALNDTLQKHLKSDVKRG